MNLQEKIEQEIKDSFLMILNRQTNNIFNLAEEDAKRIIRMVEKQVLFAISDSSEEMEAFEELLK